MIANKVYTRDEMREEHIVTSDYHFIDKDGEYYARQIMRAEASKKMLRLFFQLSDGRRLSRLCSVGRITSFFTK